MVFTQGDGDAAFLLDQGDVPVVQAEQGNISVQRAGRKLHAEIFCQREIRPFVGGSVMERPLRACIPNDAVSDNYTIYAVDKQEK